MKGFLPLVKGEDASDLPKTIASAGSDAEFRNSHAGEMRHPGLAYL